MNSLRTVFVLIVAIVIVQLAQSLLAVHIPLAMASDGLSTTGIGLVAAAYAAGFMGGAWLGPRLLARVGHIRVFAACAAVAAAATLTLHAADITVAWMAVRVGTGAAIALMFAASESWMNSAIPRSERGSVMGVYMVCTKAALATGPFLAVTHDGAAPEPLMVAAALIALAMVPVCFTATEQPEPPKSEPLALRALFRTAPAAVVAVMTAGIVNGGVLALSATYAAAVYGPETARDFYAAAWIGSLLLQWPAGRLSDSMDRRLVIALLAGFAALCAIALALLGGTIPFVAAASLYALYGAGALSYYGIAAAHMADRADPTSMARATAGLLFVWAAGSIIGPLALGPVVDLFGPAGIFWFAGAALFLMSLAMLWRLGARGPTPIDRKGAFAGKQPTSVAAAELGYGEGDLTPPGPTRPLV